MRETEHKQLVLIRSYYRHFGSVIFKEGMGREEGNYITISVKSY